MRDPGETVIATLPSQSSTERLQVVLVQDGPGGSCLQLRQQSWGEGVGWFTQSSIELEPQQLAALKMTLGSVPSRHRPAAPARSAAALRLVHADSA